jgi:hypothetical protein
MRSKEICGVNDSAPVRKSKILSIFQPVRFPDRALSFTYSLPVVELVRAVRQPIRRRFPCWSSISRIKPNYASRGGAQSATTGMNSPNGDNRRPAQLTLRAAAHLGHCWSEHGVPIECADDELIDFFIRPLPACASSLGFHGRDRYHAVGARHFLSYLRTKGIVPPTKRSLKDYSAQAPGFLLDWPHPGRNRGFYFRYSENAGTN